MKTNLITRQGFNQLKQELDHLWRQKRPEVTKKVSWAASLGAWVEIENEQGETMTLRIVGPDEIYARKDYISIDSPMARALLKKQADEEVWVNTPTGKKQWFVNRVYYEQE